MLVYDSFEAYVTDTVKASFKRKHTDLAVTPGGLTSLLQPLDVSLNKPFKDGVRKEWMADGGLKKECNDDIVRGWYRFTGAEMASRSV